MRNIIKAEAYKQKVNGMFRLYIIIMSIVGVGISLTYGLSYKYDNGSNFMAYNNLLSNSLMLNMVVATVSVYYFVKDFSDKSIQHMIVLYKDRKKIILAKYIVFNLGTAITFFAYIISGMIVSVAFFGIEKVNNYNINIFMYVMISFILKNLYIMAFSGLCMIFCYIVRNTAAYILIIFSLWFSFLGELSQMSNIKDSPVLNKLFSMIIVVQDQIMFTNRMGSRYFNVTGIEILTFLGVVIITIFISCYITYNIMKRTEIH